MTQEEIVPVIHKEISRIVIESVTALLSKPVSFFDTTHPSTCGIPQTEWLCRHGFKAVADSNPTAESAKAWHATLAQTLAAKFVAETQEHERTLVRIKDWISQQ